MVYSSTNTVIGSLVYTYDGFNQQASVSANSGTVTAHYTYNAQGIRDSKTLGITTTEFLLDGGAVIGEQTGSSIDTYLRGSNLISSNGEEYYLFNGHGDVVNLSNANGNSTKTYEYDAFGVEQNIDQLDHNPFRYCGEFYDEETGTYYLRARYYDPKRGRFTQEDTLGLNAYAQNPSALMAMQTGNLYAYCVNNPVMYRDPGGRKVDLSPHVKQTMVDPVGGTGHTEGVVAEMAAEAKAIAEAAALEKAAEEAEAAAAAATEAAAGEMAETIDNAMSYIECLIDFEATSTYEESTDFSFLGVTQTAGTRNIYAGNPSGGALTLGKNTRLDNIWFSNIYTRMDFILFDLEMNAGLDSIGFNLAFDIGEDSVAGGYYIDLSKLSLCAETRYTDAVDENNFIDYFNSTSISFLDLALLFWNGTLPQFSVPSNLTSNPLPA